MSLNIYVGVDNLPKTKPYIIDVEKDFFGLKISNDKYTRLVLQNVEGGSYYSEYSFIDRCGRPLDTQCLSTSTKLLLLLHYTEDFVYNGVELCMNAYRYLYQLDSGHVYFKDGIPWFDDDMNIGGVDININGMHVTEYCDLCAIMEDGGLLC